MEQEQIFFRLWTALGVGLFVSFVIFRFLLERDPSHQAYIQATNALEIEAYNKRVDERNYRWCALTQSLKHIYLKRPAMWALDWDWKKIYIVIGQAKIFGTTCLSIPFGIVGTTSGGSFRRRDPEPVPYKPSSSVLKNQLANYTTVAAKTPW